MSRRPSRLTAREDLIVRHLPLARGLALRYVGRGQALDDLVQVASLALVKAADRWDPTRGVAFSAYAVPTILGELRHHFRDATWDLRPPRRLQDLALAVVRARDELLAERRREPTVADLAERLQRTPEDIVNAIEAGHSRRLASLDAEVEDDATVGELVGGDDAGFARAEARVTLQRLTLILDARSREVLRLSFEHDLPQSEIAKRLGVSQVGVSRILRAALDKLSAHALEPLAA